MNLRDQSQGGMPPAVARLLLGPAGVLGPYAFAWAAGPRWAAAIAALLIIGVVLCVRLWMYYQPGDHRGVRMMSRRAWRDESRRVGEADWWFFNINLFIPLLLYMSSGFYADALGVASPGLLRPVFGDISLAAIVYPITWATYLVMLCGYLTWQGLLWWAGATVNRAKVGYMVLLVPAQVVAISLVDPTMFGAAGQMAAGGVVAAALQHYYVAL